GERRTSARHRVEGPYSAHRDLEGSGARPLSRRPPEPGRRRSRRPGRARRGAARHLRLSDRYRHFSEDFTIEGLPDDEVCIGDRYQIGSALFEVTQPRVTCYRVGIRMSEPRMPALLTGSGRPGFYFRVLREGEVGAGDEIVKVGEAKVRMTVA